MWTTAKVARLNQREPPSSATQCNTLSQSPQPVKIARLANLWSYRWGNWKWYQDQPTQGNGADSRTLPCLQSPLTQLPSTLWLGQHPCAHATPKIHTRGGCSISPGLCAPKPLLTTKKIEGKSSWRTTPPKPWRHQPQHLSSQHRPCDSEPLLECRPAMTRSCSQPEAYIVSSKIQHISEAHRPANFVRSVFLKPAPSSRNRNYTVAIWSSSSWSLKPLHTQPHDRVSRWVASLTDFDPCLLPKHIRLGSATVHITGWLQHCPNLSSYLWELTKGEGAILSLWCKFCLLLEKEDYPHGKRIASYWTMIEMRIQTGSSWTPMPW